MSVLKKLSKPVLFAVFVVALNGVFLGSSHWAVAALPKSLLDSLVTAMSKSTDEAVQGAQKLFKNLDDIKWQKYGDELAGNGLSEADTFAKMRNLLGATELSPDLSDSIRGLSHAERQTLVSLLDSSKRIFKIGTEQGVSPETIFRAVERGGPDAVLGLRAMKTSDGVADGIRGFDRFGDQFATFVKQGDEGAVRSLMKQADEVALLKKSQLDDILSNPAKYFDAAGKPTRAFDDLVGSAKLRSGTMFTTKRVAVAAAIGTVAYAFCPDRVFDFLEKVLPKDFVDALRSIKWLIRYGLLIALITAGLYFLWPLLAPILVALSLSLLKWMVKIPGRFGKMAAERLRAIDERKRTTLNKVGGVTGEIGKEQILRLGLLGSRRAGKSTFITLLNDKLKLLVPGATLGFANATDKTELEKIRDVVVRGVPTTEEHEISLDLTWPFAWQKDGGHWQGLLCLKDYPGEHACSDIGSKDFKGLAEYLRNVDGLFVVIDPTELELKGEGSRKARQEAVINQMFSREGLNLGQAFKRSLAILITKRDAMDDAWFDSHRPADMPEERLRPIRNLAKKPSLTCEESQQLGQAVFEMLYPNTYLALQNRLSPVQGGQYGMWSWLWSWIWPARPESAHVAAFAVSQLGFSAGKRVSEARKVSTAPLEPPLDLDAIDKSELDIHHPFSWMFNSIPGGWLNEINAESGRKTLLWNSRRGVVRSRFRGAPIIRQDISVGWRKGGLIAAIAFSLVVLLNWGAEDRARQYELANARQTLDAVLAKNDATSQDYRGAISHCRQLPTKPLGIVLDKLATAVGTLTVLEEIEVEIGKATDELPRKKLELLEKWFSVYRGGYTNLGENPSEELVRFQQRENERVREKVRTYQSTLKDYSTVAPPDEAYNVARTATDEITRLGSLSHLKMGLEQSTNEIGGICEDMRKAYVQYLLREEVEEIEELIRQKHFPDAIRKYDGFASRYPDNTEVTEYVKQKRNSCIARYWDDLSSTTREAEMQGDFASVEKQLVEFLNMPRLGDFEQDAELRLQSIPNKRVLFAVNSAVKLLVEGKNDDAWRELNTVHGDLSKVESVTRQTWTEQAVEVQKRRGEYAAAIDLLVNHPDPTQKQQLLVRCWGDWIEHAEKSVPQLLAEKKFAEARLMLKQLDTARLTCPEDLRRKVKELGDRWQPELNVAEAVDQAEKAGEQANEKLLDSLLSLRKTGDIEKLNDNRELRERWVNAVVGTYTALGKHREAIVFLDSLKDVSNTVIETKRRAYIEAVDQRYSAMMKEHRDEAALKILLDEWYSENELNEATRQELKDYIREKIESALTKIETDTRQKAETSDYKGALAMLDTADKMFQPLRKLPDFPSDERLGSLRNGLTAKYIKSRIDRVETRDLTPQDFRKNYNEIQSIRSEKLGEQERSRLDTKQRELLANWEKSLYNSVLDAVENGNFSVLQERANEYLKSDQPYAEVRSDKRVNDVGKIKAWIDLFDAKAPYTLTAIRYEKMPAAFPLYLSNYDLKIRVTVGDDKAIAEENNVQGSGTIEAISSRKFGWKKGVRIVIQVWQGSLDAKGYCIGTIELPQDSYSLLSLALGGKFASVTLKDYATNSDFKDSGFSLGLSVDGLKSIPELPQHDGN